MADRGPALVDQLVEASPHRMYETGDGPQTGCELLVVGHVVKAVVGRRSGGWLTLQLEISVDEVLGVAAGVEMPTPLRVGVAMGTQVDVESVVEAYLAAGPLVLPLWTSPVFQHDDSLLSIASDGDFLTFVGASGTLSSAAFSDTDEVTFLEGARTLEELRLNVVASRSAG